MLRCPPWARWREQVHIRISTAASGSLGLVRNGLHDSLIRGRDRPIALLLQRSEVRDEMLTDLDVMATRPTADRQAIMTEVDEFAAFAMDGQYPGPSPPGVFYSVQQGIRLSVWRNYQHRFGSTDLGQSFDGDGEMPRCSGRHVPAEQGRSQVVPTASFGLFRQMSREVPWLGPLSSDNDEPCRAMAATKDLSKSSGLGTELTKLPDPAPTRPASYVHGNPSAAFQVFIRIFFGVAGFASVSSAF